MNRSEKRLVEALSKLGITAIRNGWPDFLCVAKNAQGESRPVAVQLKSWNDCLSPIQMAVHRILNDAGLPTYTVVEDYPGHFRGIEELSSVSTGSRKQIRCRPIRGVFEKVRGSGVWWIRYFDAEGRKRREKAGSIQSAIDLYRARKTAVTRDRIAKQIYSGEISKRSPFRSR